MMNLFIKLLLFSNLLAYNIIFGKVLHYQPEQVHLSFGDSVSEIIVMWSTKDKPDLPIVEYGISDLILNATGTSNLFIDGGPAKSSQYFHKVKLLNLRPNTKYFYHCGSSLGWSSLFWFKTPQNNSNWSPSLAIFGDMGNENAQSLGRLQEETQKEMYDTIIHVGDFAYDMNFENGEVGDEFMKQIETIAAYVPYMVCPGNHEEKYNFSHYQSRFSMPGGTERLMYSFNLGPVHFIGFSTEVYYFMNYGIKTLVNQYEWLKNDLEEASKPKNRNLRPWIITYGHRPMYCSNNNKNDCTHSETLVRVGLPFVHFFGLEDLFYKYGVDVEIWAHEHSYERLWPIYDYKVYNGSYEKPYTNPGAPVHIVTGSAGCSEGREPFPSDIPDWSAFHSQDYGYTRLKAHNKSHLYFEQVSDDKNDNNEIIVTWNTRDDAKESIVEFGIDNLNLIAKGSSKKFVDGGQGKYFQYIHKVKLNNLQANRTYIYHCGGKFGWSAEFWFKTVPSGSKWSPSLAIFGDMGNENAQSLARLQEDTQRKMYDAIIHVGDFAYDMDSYNAEVGDEFMRQVESIAAYVPYMVCAGNHEEKYNFSNYRARFNMPGGYENLMYSFNMGPVHFIGFSTEIYYFLKYGIKQVVKQYDWLENDLKEATKPENRAVRPWIITYGHRPMYCSNDNGDDCSKHETVVRRGLPMFVSPMFGLEDLFYKYGVDVELWAHEHSYERLWPIYNYNVFNGSFDKPYTNPKAPVHLVTGSAGCKEGREPFFKIIPKWSAFHSQDYGYTRLKAHNNTHLYFEQISDDKNGAVIDKFWIIKDYHGSYV